MTPVPACAPYANNGYIAIGTQDIAGPNPDVYVVYTDALGNSAPGWESTYDVQGLGLADDGVAIVAVPGQGYVFLSNSFNGVWSPALTFIDCKGKVVWSQIYPDNLASQEPVGQRPDPHPERRSAPGHQPGRLRGGRLVVQLDPRPGQRGRLPDAHQRRRRADLEHRAQQPEPQRGLQRPHRGSALRRRPGFRPGGGRPADHHRGRPAGPGGAGQWQQRQRRPPAAMHAAARQRRHRRDLQLGGPAELLRRPVRLRRHHPRHQLGPGHLGHPRQYLRAHPAGPLRQSGRPGHHRDRQRHRRAAGSQAGRAGRQPGDRRRPHPAEQPADEGRPDGAQSGAQPDRRPALALRHQQSQLRDLLLGRRGSHSAVGGAGGLRLQRPDPLAHRRPPIRRTSTWCTTIRRWSTSPASSSGTRSRWSPTGRW